MAIDGSNLRAIEGSMPNQEVTNQKPKTPSEEVLPSSTGIKWSEVLGVQGNKGGSSGEVTFHQAIEDSKKKSKEVEVSQEVLTLAEDNLVELFYLLNKGSGLPEEILSLQKTLKLIIPQFDQLKKQDPITAIREYQRIVREILGDKKRCGQFVALAASYQEYKFSILKKAYKITPKLGEPPPEEVQRETEIAEARESLKRSKRVLVIDEEGRIVPQSEQLSRDEYIKQKYKGQSVPLWRRLIGGVEEYQKRKAADEYDRMAELLRETSAEKQKASNLEYNFTIAAEGLSDEEKFFLRELGFIGDGEKVKQPDEVLGDLMREIQSTYTLRREILVATGMPVDQVVKQAVDIITQDQFALIPELSSLTVNIKSQIEQARRGVVEQVRENLGKRKEAAILSQLRKREEELRKREQELLKKLEEEKKTKKEATTPEETISNEVIRERIERALNSIPNNQLNIKKINDLLVILGLESEPKKTEQSEPEEDKQTSPTSQIETLLSLEMEIAALEQEVNGEPYKRERDSLQEEIKNLKEEKRRLRGLLSTPIIETMTKEGVTQIQRVDTKMVREMIGEIDKEINSAVDNLKLLETKERQLSDKKRRLAIIETFLNEELTINQETKTIRQWLEEYARQSSISTGVSKGESVQTEVEKVRSELNQVRGLIRYYDESELNARCGRIAEMGNLRPGTIVKNDLLLTVESANPRLDEILRGIKELKVKRQFVFVLIQTFGKELVIPDDPNSEAVIDMVALLKAISSQDPQIVTQIKTPKDLDKLLEILVHQILKLKEGKPLDNNN